VSDVKQPCIYAHFISVDVIFRHGSSRKGSRRNKKGILSRSRAGQAVAAHHARNRISRVVVQIKKRMWKSALSRVKRLRDQGRVSKPVVKKEVGPVAWRSSSALEVEAPDRSDEDEITCDLAGSTDMTPVIMTTEGATSVASGQCTDGDEAVRLATSAEVVPESQGKRRSAKRGLSDTKVAKKTANEISREIKRLRKEAQKIAE